MNRAYSLLTIKEVDDDKRIITGIASTPTPDRMNDIIELEGMEFKTPMPFLYQHDSKQPIGHVTSAKKTKNGLEIVAKIAKGIAPFIDQAWELIKAGLVHGLSIGFRPIDYAFMKDSDGIRFSKTELYEISAVTIPANAEASILTVKSADALTLAALGDRRERIVRLGALPGGSGQTITTKGKTMTLAEQITSFEAKRAAHEARMTEMMDKAQKEGRTFEESETEEYDGLAGDIKKIDDHLVRLRAHEKSIISRATAITDQTAGTQQAAQNTRSGVIQVRANQPKGIGVARMAIAMIRAQGNPYQAIELAKLHWGDQSPEVAMHIKAVVEAGDTTTSGWASQLLPAAQQMDVEFIDMLRAKIVMGRITGFKRVPFNVAVPLQSGGGTYGYVGEGAPKPVTKPTYGSATLRFEKAAGIIVITDELARFSSPDAEMLVRDELLKGLTAFFDGVFVGAAAAVSNVSPAGIRNGISATAASGTTAARFRYDMNIIIQNMITNNQNPADLAIIMSSGIAMSLSSMINSLGQSEFPTINATGGNYLGIPITDSQAAGTNIILLNPSDILLAEDAAIRIDVSREASVEMSDTPILGDTSPTTNATLKSFWQNNLVGLRVEQYRTWKVSRTSAVEYISGAAYTPPTS